MIKNRQTRKLIEKKEINIRKIKDKADEKKKKLKDVLIKRTFKPGNMLYPLPAVMVSCCDEDGNDNIFTVAWAGTVCTNPPMVSISVRPSRFSYGLIKKTGEFVINLPGANLAEAVDFCGVRSGRNIDKFKYLSLTREKADFLKVPLIGECPVNIECRVKKEEELGSHHLFIAEVLSVHVSEFLMDEKDKLHLSDASLMVYSHGNYYSLGKKIGSFGYSVKKKN